MLTFSVLARRRDRESKAVCSLAMGTEWTGVEGRGVQKNMGVGCTLRGVNGGRR